MLRGGAITFGDLGGKLGLLRVACRKCERQGQYHVSKLIERYRRQTGHARRVRKVLGFSTGKTRSPPMAPGERMTGSTIILAFWAK